MFRETTKCIWAKDGRPIAPSTRIDVIHWPDNGWRIAFLVDEPSRDGVVTLSDHDLNVHTKPCP